MVSCFTLGLGGDVWPLAQADSACTTQNQSINQYRKCLYRDVASTVQI